MKSILSFFIIIVIVLTLSLIPNSGGATKFHSPEELEHFRNQFRDPVDPSLYFATSTFCKGCHGFDDEGLSLIDGDMNDVNIYDDWSASMMALSAKDPFWRAKVSHESMISPDLQNLIETKCTSCHAPMGHYQKLFDGHEEYTIADMLVDTIGLDGVSCGACHQLDKTKLGQTFSGDLNYDTTRTLFGPYPLPFTGPMAEFVGFKPKFGDHVFLSEMCASCHTLITETISPEGEITGDEFVEQATYHEWLNSSYSEIGTSCQSCHMPYLDDGVIISSGYTELNPRFPFALHQMPGANTMMLNLMNTFKDTLDLDAKDSAFEENILATRDLLRSSLVLSILSQEIIEDSLVIELKLQNKAGHKFPSGYPARRAWIECLAVSHENDTIFHSGKLNQDFRMIDRDDHYEPHHDIIASDQQVQIYQLVSVDVNLDVTTILTRGFKSIKDNRLPPTGFTQAHAVYDTTQILGKALIDPNFNFENNVEGSGSDIITYKIDLNGFNGTLDIDLKVWYQSIPPEWTDELFSASNPTIDLFKMMYDSVRAVPELISEALIEDIVISTTSIHGAHIDPNIELYPNPLTGDVLYFKGLELDKRNVQIEVIDLLGQSHFKEFLTEESFNMSQLQPGLFTIILRSEKEIIFNNQLIKIGL